VTRQHAPAARPTRAQLTARVRVLRRETPPNARPNYLHFLSIAEAVDVIEADLDGRLPALLEQSFRRMSLEAQLFLVHTARLFATKQPRDTRAARVSRTPATPPVTAEDASLSRAGRVSKKAGR
jgi:hypothetical protein